MRNITLALATYVLSTAADAQVTKSGTNRTITVANTSSIQLTDKAVSIKRTQLPAIPAGVVYPVLLSSGGDTIPAQLDDLNGDNKWDELFFVISLKPGASQALSLIWVSEQPVYTKRTSIRFGKRMRADEPVTPATTEVVYASDMPKKMGFQRYQTDGPTWENDKVGFLHYLDGRNAKDVFGKRVSAISPETVGISKTGAVEDNYHVMEAWGRDVMAVGNSIGLGGVALLKNDSIMRLGITVDDSVNNIEKTTFKIVTEGPVRSAMHISYQNWKPRFGKYSVEENTSIWPGMYAYNNAVKVSGLQGNERLLIGLVSIFATKPPIEVRVNEKWIALISHDRHSYNKEWWLPLALLLPANIYDGVIEAPKSGKLSNSYLAKLKVSNNKPVQYYAIAGWENSDEGFKKPDYFQRYVEDLARQLSAQVKVTIK
ncbi:DUF4861 domain-containing protein [Segetibacter sp. 3557_3]|uniref:DUF4861 family protein n=1 Tax=Segetibacter sp. 3557_3 TaxID=2547429 RepID=UPI0010590F7C|nr:DUF4861 family protein [Segetibacter sp. 3557_3]TDH24214.1 DUF4861 domain-containing protein [Segetibacter sp. 3557_3]